MKVLVTGATGFIGRHVVCKLLENGHSVLAVSRDACRAEALSWPETVQFLACDIHLPNLNVGELFGRPDAAIHLAWPDLPNYKNLSHYEETLFSDYRFLKSIIAAGCQHILVAGTCLEYGMQDGCLTEDMPVQPTTPYAIAKDCLRRFLEALQKDMPFNLQWARLFYMYGSGQNEKSLIAQLEKALVAGDLEFPMSGGEQLRDYLPVEAVAEKLTNLVVRSDVSGIINVCSGKPISVRKLVEDFLISRGGSIKLALGAYAYPDYEPMAFWGGDSRYKEIIGLE